MTNKDLVREVLDDLLARLPVGYALEHLEPEVWIILNDREEMIAGGPTATAALDAALSKMRR